jgi:hypothetical protein
MSAKPTTTARKPKALPLTLADRAALSYAARILYTIPVHQWSNACDMVDMIEGKACGRDGYILGQARAIWNAQSWPSEECFFASETQLGWADRDPERGREKTIAFWENYISENVAVVKKADADLTAEVEADAKAKKAKPDLKVVS